MIVKLTFNDNDYTQIIENFLNKTMLMNIKYCLNKYKSAVDEYSVKKYCEISKRLDFLTDKIIYGKPLSEEEKQEFINFAKESLLDYIRDFHNKDYKYLAQNLTIDVLDKIEDKWENGESVYYFPMHGQSITM